MPSCSRFALHAVVFAFAGYFVVLALAELVVPQQREMSTNIALRPQKTESAQHARSSASMQVQAGLYDKLQALPLSGR
jgi:hypothetical protein